MVVVTLGFRPLSQHTPHRTPRESDQETFQTAAAAVREQCAPVKCVCVCVYGGGTHKSYTRDEATARYYCVNIDDGGAEVRLQCTIPYV